MMGVSGSGKTTVAEQLAERHGWTYLEGDDLHPKSNVEKMASGHPLTDEDRWPWLDRIGGWIDSYREDRNASPAVITCSALRRVYRDRIGAGRGGVVFCHLRVPKAQLEDRMEHRQGHYMPASLLQSQLDTLEDLGPDESGFVVEAGGDPEDVYADVERALSERGLV